MSSDELVRLLLRVGAKVLAIQEHGVFLEARRRLIFLRRAPVIDCATLHDALRAAAIGPGRFDILLAELRREGQGNAPLDDRSGDTTLRSTA